MCTGKIHICNYDCGYCRYSDLNVNHLLTTRRVEGDLLADRKDHKQSRLLGFKFKKLGVTCILCLVLIFGLVAHLMIGCILLLSYLALSYVCFWIQLIFLSLVCNISFVTYNF